MRCRAGVAPPPPEDAKAAYAEYLSANTVPEMDTGAPTDRAADTSSSREAAPVPKWFKVKK